MKKYFLLAFPLVIALLLCNISCNKKFENPDSTSPTTPNLPTSPAITSIVPKAAHGGDTITVNGTNLGGIANLTVTINNSAATIISVSDTSIEVVVPVEAGSGSVILSVNGQNYAGPEFTYVERVMVTTIAGTGSVGNADGPGESASFNCPWGIAYDASGALLVADCYNRLIRKISPDKTVSSYTIPVLVGGANFYSPYDIAIDAITHNIYVTDFNEHLLRMDPSGNMSVILVDTMPLAGIAVSPDGKNLFISNNTLGTIIKTDIDGQNPTTFTTGLTTPRNIIFNNKGDMFVAAYPASIYGISATGVASPVATDPEFQGWEIAADTSGNFYLADHFANRIRKIDKSGNVSTIAGNGVAADVDGDGPNSSFDGPQGITIDAAGNLYVTTYNYDTKGGNKVRKITFER